MGIFLMFLILCVIGAIVIIIGVVIECNTNADGEFCYWIGGFACGIGVIAMFFCGLIALVISCQREVTYQQYELAYRVISAKINTAEENYYLFVDEINEYNNAILEDRYWADNFWVNWYHNGKIKDLPLIGE